jgi:hypothetical protein
MSVIVTVRDNSDISKCGSDTPKCVDFPVSKVREGEMSFAIFINHL